MNEATLLEKAFLLKKTALFSEVDLDLVLAISDKAQILEFDSGETIFSKNQDASLLYIILEGSVIVFDPDTTDQACVEAPDFFGDEALFTQERRTYSARCETDVTCMAISHRSLSEIILEAPQVALSLLRLYSRKLGARRLIPHED